MKRLLKLLQLFWTISHVYITRMQKYLHYSSFPLFSYSLNWIIVELCRTPVDVFLQPHNQSQVICYCIHSLCMAQCCFYMSTQLVYFSVSNCDCLECASVTVILHLSSTPVHGFLTQNYMELNGLSVQPTGCGICFKKYFKYAIIAIEETPSF